MSRRAVNRLDRRRRVNVVFVGGVCSGLLVAALLAAGLYYLSK